MGQSRLGLQQFGRTPHHQFLQRPLVLLELLLHRPALADVADRCHSGDLAVPGSQRGIELDRQGTAVFFSKQGLVLVRYRFASLATLVSVFHLVYRRRVNHEIHFRTDYLVGTVVAEHGNEALINEDVLAVLVHQHAVEGVRRESQEIVVGSVHAEKFNRENVDSISASARKITSNNRVIASVLRNINL